LQGALASSLAAPFMALPHTPLSPSLPTKDIPYIYVLSYYT